LEGFVEFPVHGGDVERQTAIAGWHAWGGRPVAAVAIEVDGRVVGGGHPGPSPRDDVAAERDEPRYAKTGWVAELDLRAVHTPTVTIGVTVFPGIEHPGVRLDPITVHVLGDPTLFEDGTPIPLPDEVHGHLDVPAANATADLGALTVRGWARCTSASISHVELSANGTALGRARIGIDRADVAAADDAADAPISGFEQVVDLAVLGESTTRATIVATPVALDGTTTDFSVVVDVRASARPGPREDGSSNDTAVATGGFDLLVVTHDLGIGGGQLWLHEALRVMGAGRDFPCTVLAFASGPLVVELERLGIDVHVSSPLPVHDNVAYEGRLDELAAWLQGSQHTVALVNTFRAFPGADLAQRHGLPVVWAVHESWPESLVWAFDHPGVVVDPTVRASASRALARSGAVVFESAATKSLYDARAPDRTALVPYGIDTAAIDRFAAATSRTQARHALRLPEDGRVILVMGTIEPRKGQTLLAEAFAHVADHYPDTTMGFVGDLSTSYSRALREFVRRAGVASRVRIEPMLTDVASWYRAADLLVCGSDVESLPRSVLDAMCMGLPVVATRVFGLTELLTDGETGLLYEPNDLSSSVAALERALSMDTEVLAAIARRGSALVHERHDSSGYASQVLALLRGLYIDPAARPDDVLGRSAGRTVPAQSARA